MRAIGVIDGLEVIDPETGDTKWVESTGGLQFAFCDPNNPQARVRGRLAVRNGGMVVFETTGTMEGVVSQRGVNAHDVQGAQPGVLPPDEATLAELADQHRAQAPRRRQAAPASA